MTAEEQERSRCIINRYVDSEVAAPLLEMLENDQILIGRLSQSAAAVTPWFAGTFVVNGPRFFAERDETMIANDFAHEYKHILQQRTPEVRRLYDTGTYEPFREFYESDARGFAARHTRVPADGGALGNEQNYCPAR
jgi:hypothetical protein